jgi:thiol-disulfide isomerase/thioredoxin
MTRKRLNIPSKVESPHKTEDEKVKDVLSSLDTIKTKRQNIITTSQSSSFTPKILLACLFIVIIGMASVLSLGGFAQQANNDENSSEESFTDFEIQLLDERKILFSDFVGKPFILDLMTTWCGPCITQIGYFQSVHFNFPNVQIISVTVDLNYDDINTLTQFKEEHKMEWVVGRDITQKAAKTYLLPTAGIPTLVYFDSAGIMKQHHEGLVDFDTLTTWITSS